jgi:hypothetical protein
MRFLKTYESFQFGDARYVLLSKDRKLCAKVGGYSTKSFYTDGIRYKIIEVTDSNEIHNDNYEDVLYPKDSIKELEESIKEYFEGENLSYVDYPNNVVYYVGNLPELYRHYEKKRSTIEEIKKMFSQFEPVEMIIGGFTNDDINI